ncbi:putative bifunctional cytochrome P450 group I:NADPH-P450 reductase [Triangularia verruculosa]|uniref:Bifunctional cytochrome P450/NADPH--P450 reductase n=1 Tax=Triangularia verruculosa TaxID=2587418 RepID=A0AAN7AUF0_9PEZI|nr:putative bifunctional cytochrome P450 group I:NADPH-P450 reductase [Triangularia verruculosa]
MAATDAMSCPMSGLDKEATGMCPALYPGQALDSAKDPMKAEQEEVIDHSKLLKIPSPPHGHYFGLLGHAPDLDPILPVKTYWELMDKYGEIFQLDLGMAYPRVFVGSRELVNEMADDERFSKFTHRLHKEMRPVFGDGLFSAESTDKAWWKAHRLLVPMFGPLGLSKMFEDMQDLSAQLVLKWDRFGPEHEIECIDDMARLAFDTVGLCAFGYRFNEFYTADHHPFMTQLKESIVESGRRANRPEVLNHLYYKEEQHRQENIAKMKELCKKIIQDRIDSPKPEANDLLNLMIHGVDRETGEKLTRENIEYQIPTFLGAGYETTSSTLSFIFYFFCTYPETIIKAQQEIDEVVGDKVLTYEMLSKLKYLDACIKEALRIQHPSSLLTRFAVRDTVIGGKYLIRKGQMCSGIWRHFHRDPAVWGEDADDFKPERMLDRNFQTLPPNSWKPFGDGQRACIGRGFAEQEILICCAMVLQKFDIEKADRSYIMELKGQMAVKPIDFKIRVKRRAGKHPMIGIPGGGSQPKMPAAKTRPSAATTDSSGPKKPITVLFGGNMGTAESLMQSLSRTAPDFGLEVDVRALDSGTDNLPTNRPCVIITPSYDGRPPDNAKKFVKWLEKLVSSDSKLPGVKFAVFGLGNSDWVNTFYKIPKFIDETLESLGAERLLEAGYGNVKQDLVGPWESWSEELCLTLSGVAPDKGHKAQAGVEVSIERHNLKTLPRVLGGDQMGVGTIHAICQLADTSVGPAKYHVEVRLPPGCHYRAGDYLVVQGRNSDEAVHRAMARFGLSPEDTMTVQSSKKDFLPSQPMAVEHFLRSSVELAAPITKRQLLTLSLHAEEASEEKAKLVDMSQDSTYESLLANRHSVLDVLTTIPSLTLPFGVFIDLLPPLAPRVYSISSSPLAPSSGSLKSGLIVSITFDLFQSPALSGIGTFNGVASAYLSSRKVGDEISCLVRPTTLPFQLPKDQAKPVVMVAAGSGIAPMRGLLQERAELMEQGCDLGEAVLFFGCRNEHKDYLYRDELEQWEKDGVVRVVPCFSRPGSVKGSECSIRLRVRRGRLSSQGQPLAPSPTQEAPTGSIAALPADSDDNGDDEYGDQRDDEHDDHA